MLTRAQGRAQRRALMKDIAREDKRKKREHLAALRAAIVGARAAHKRARVHAIEHCRAGRLRARARSLELRLHALEELKRAIALERGAALAACSKARGAAADEKTKRARASAELKAEQQFRRDMRRIEKSARERRRELDLVKRKGERQQHSDDEVRGNIPPELIALFNKVRRIIKPTAHRSRTEAFLEYAEARPSEVLEALEDKTEATIRDLERRERLAAAAVKKPLSRAELSALVPF
jgi:hypothetical protein